MEISSPLTGSHRTDTAWGSEEYERVFDYGIIWSAEPRCLVFTEVSRGQGKKEERQKEKKKGNRESRVLQGPMLRNARGWLMSPVSQSTHIYKLEQRGIRCYICLLLDSKKSVHSFGVLVSVLTSLVAVTVVGIVTTTRPPKRGQN